MKPLLPFLDKKSIVTGARKSPLSRAQYQEVLKEIQSHFPSITLTPLFVDTIGDIDKKTSLRHLGKTDFFTKEIDAMLLKKECRIGIHSAKDLPEPLPKGLAIIAVTRGVDSSDSLVFRDGETLAQLPPQAIIATSSERREEAVSQLRSDLRFIDLRGTISERLQKLETKEADGVVVAEAALIRLGLTHLNRIKIPGKTAPAQGQLAIVAREDDQEMKILFAPLDARPTALYLGLTPPPSGDILRKFFPFPIIQIISYEENLEEKLTHFLRATHLLFTSKTAAQLLFGALKKKGIDVVEVMRKKTTIAIGQRTAQAVQAWGFPIAQIAQTETSEGLLEELKKKSLKNSYFFWPHSALSRSLISDWFQEEGARLGILLEEVILYDTIPCFPGPLPEKETYEEIFFTSPSTVKAFSHFFGQIPEGKKGVAIGPVTEGALKDANHSTAV